MKPKEKLKILITAPALDEKKNVSGISTVARQIIERGTFDYKHFPAGKSDGERRNAVWALKQIVLPWQFYRIIKSEKIDLVHINTAFNPLSILRDFALVKAARLAGRPVLLHLHGGKFLARDFEKDRLKQISEKMLRAADAVLVLSELEKEIIEKRWKSVKAKVLENAVEPDDYPEIEKTKNSIVFLGRLHESKGLREIIEAVRRLRSENHEFTLKIFGAGDLQSALVEEMTSLLGERFYFGGVIAGETKRKELAASDIFLLPSRYGEGLPMALLEAMAAKCIVVASEMASVGAVVRNGFNGFLIEPGNVSQLVEALRMILAGETDFEDLRKNARATIKGKFNLADYIEKLENIYESIFFR